MKEIRNKSICCICDTTYQLLNILGILYYENMVEQNSVDVYINVSIIDKYPMLANKIKSMWGVRNVYCQYMEKDHHIIEKIQRILFPRKFISKRTDNKYFSMQYDVIFMAVPTHFSISMFFCNPQSEVYYYEDGLGSYYLDLIKWIYKKEQRLCYLLMGKNIKQSYPKAIYLNLPDMYNGIMGKDIRHSCIIKKGDDVYRNNLRNLFHTSSDMYMNRKVVYLTQPIYKIPGFSEKSKGMLADLEAIVFADNNSIIRIHPADNKDYSSANGKIDRSSGVWELICEKEINDNNILIAYYSTAQFIPKILYGKEPRIVFLYKMFPELISKQELVEMDKTVKIFRGIYTNKKKIYLPHNKEEFLLILEQIN